VVVRQPHNPEQAVGDAHAADHEKRQAEDLPVFRGWLHSYTVGRVKPLFTGAQVTQSGDRGRKKHKM